MDPIADMLTRIKNAGLVHNETCVLPYSKLKFEIVNVLLKDGFIKSFSVKGKKVRKHIEVEIAYGEDGTARIEDVKRVSKNSRRIYLGFRDIKLVKQGKGMLILSTPKGVMNGRDARKQSLGGEALFSIW